MEEGTPELGNSTQNIQNSIQFNLIFESIPVNRFRERKKIESIQMNRFIERKKPNQLIWIDSQECKKLNRLIWIDSQNARNWINSFEPIHRR